MSFVRSVFSPTAFVIHEMSIANAFLLLETINNFDKRNRSKTVTSLQADSEGVFFSSESAEKKHTGWVGQSMSSKFKNRNAISYGWVDQSVS